ncbi:acyltransferase family protein [Emticicia fluvialis]|uniref:acyltransferase family protein n=1 Tax=Emticicia fluvialis TaxID=2974474 RepID=UPI002165CDCE|nr:acyltransferase [Emticicia fluvialis]
MNKNNYRYIPELDVIRGIAILMVFFYHTQLSIFPPYEIRNYTDSGILDLRSTKDIIFNFLPFTFGELGVELFLVISGFVIHLGFLNSQDLFNVKQFYVRRFFRIYPPYLLVLLFFIVFRNMSFSPKDILLHVLLIHNLSDTSFFSINPSFWTLALEVQLYLAYPLFLYFRKKIGIRNTVVGLTLLHFACTFILETFMKDSIPLSMALSMPVLWFTWGAGALAAELYWENKKIFKKQPLLYLLVFLAMLPVCKYFMVAHYFTIAVSVCAWLALLEWFLYKKQEDPFFLKPLFRVLAGIGICSYSLYLIHQPYLFDLLKHLGHFKFVMVHLVASPLAALLIFTILAYGLYQFVELPSVELGKRLWKKYGNPK